MGNRLFGTDGIRGKANIHPMTAEMALKVGRAAGRLFQNGNGRHTILIGKDTRRSCYMLENALTAGLCSVGINVLLTGPLPTPGVSYIMRSLRCDGAIMISASHNDYADNGIKLFAGGGAKLSDQQQAEIEARLRVEADALAVEAAANGDAGLVQDEDLDRAYGDHLVASAASVDPLDLTGLRVGLDCANGAASKVGPRVLKALGATVDVLHAAPDGANINDGCGSTSPDSLQAKVRTIASEGH
ncbi:MAG: phosphoglucosamine mutase, partial [Candidatus Hydrogenedentes bacterium]|nr:phosphoglucosamine mutase [Candidatus Hydrogenedentota bacterium]